MSMLPPPSDFHGRIIECFTKRTRLISNGFESREEDSEMDSKLKAAVGSVIVVALVTASGVALFIGPAKSNLPKGSGQTLGTMKVTILSDNLTVGFQSGLWIFALRNDGTLGITEVTAVLWTPIESKLCTGIATSSLSFYNCPAVEVAPLPQGVKIGGYTTGTGPGSAVPGQVYNVTITALFEGGTSSVLDAKVKAVSA